MTVDGMRSDQNIAEDSADLGAAPEVTDEEDTGSEHWDKPTQAVDQAPSAAESDIGMQRRVSGRKVGTEYSFQVILNSLPLLLVDILALTIVIAACRAAFTWLGFSVGLDVSAGLVPIATGFVLINLEMGIYPGVRLSPVEEFRRLIVSVTAVFVMWAVCVAVLAGGLTVQRWFLLAVYLLCLMALPVCHSWARRMLGSCRFCGFPVLICGDSAAACSLYDWIATNPRLGLRPVGVIGHNCKAGDEASNRHYVGDWTDVDRIAKEHAAYWAIVIPTEKGSSTLPELIAKYLSGIPHIHVLSEFTGLPDYGSVHQHMDGLTGVHFQQNLMLPLPRLTKRLIDLAAALTGGLLLLPLLFYIAVAVKLSSRGPILYGHERIGHGGRRFLAWKFRTMFTNANDVLELYLEAHPDLREEWEKDHKLRYDPRVTRIGRFLRITSLDELPQLWNVIRGQMSLVGPRPIVTAEISKYGAYYPLYTMVKPGITGLWQVSGRNNTTYDERVQLDAYYVRNWSPWMDLYLLVRTIRIVLFAEGAY